MGMFDPDHPLAANAIGTQGVSLCCLDDFRELYRDLPLETISVSASLPPVIALAGLYLVAREAGLSPANLRGSVLQAPFYAEDCGYAMHLPFKLRLRLAADTIEFASREMPKFHSFIEDTYFFSECGLDAVEEIALGLIEIRCVVREVLKRGIDIDGFAPRIAILVNCGMDFFEEVAKIRAARRLFARMMSEEFGARDPRSLSVVIASHTSGLSLTSQQPVNNVIRGTIQALALVVAGVQAIEISTFDEGYRTPSPQSHLVALRTQQIVHLESNAAGVSTLGGSYYVESLTDNIEKKIRGLVQSIEAKGDPEELVDKGWFKAMFHDAMERYSKELNALELKKVGVNVHQVPDEEDNLLKEVVQGKIEPCRGRIEHIRELKRKRSPEQVRSVLKSVRLAAATGSENMMPHIIGAMQSGATMGEIAGVMRMACHVPYDPFGYLQAPI